MQLSGSLARCEQGSIEEYMAAPRSGRSGRQRLGDGFLLGVVRRRGFVRVPCKDPAVGRDHDRADAVGRGAGSAFAAFVHGLLQETQVCGGGVGMQRVGRDLHAAQVFAGLRSALRRCEAEFRAAARAEPQLRVDGQPQGVGHAFAEEHAEDRRPALDHQPFDAPLLQLGDDQLRRNWFSG